MEIYIIIQSAFEYSDYCQKSFEAYFSEDSCKQRVDELNAQLKLFKEKYYSDRFDLDKNSLDDLTFYNQLKPFWDGYELTLYDVCKMNDFFYEKVELVDSYIHI